MRNKYLRDFIKEKNVELSISNKKIPRHPACTAVPAGWASE